MVYGNLGSVRNEIRVSSISSTWISFGELNLAKDAWRWSQRDLTIVFRSWSGTIRREICAFTLPGMTVASKIRPLRVRIENGEA